MSSATRRFISTAMGGLTLAAALLVICPLLLIFGFLLYQGASAVNVDFFLHLPKPVGEVGGGVANAIVGSLIMIALAVSLGLADRGAAPPGNDRGNLHTMRQTIR